MNTEIILNQIRLQLTDSFSPQEVNSILHILSNYTIEEKAATALADAYLPEEINHYILAKKIEGKSPETLKNYQLHLNNLFFTLQKPVSEVLTNDVRAYLYTYQEKRHIQNTSLETMRVVFSSFFSWCVANKIITANPMELIAPIRCYHKPKEGMTQLELEMMRSAATNDRDKALIEFLYSTGCRVSEVAKLLQTDINFTEKTCTVQGKGGKYRKVYINAKTELALNRYFQSRKDGNKALFVALRSPWSPLTKAGIEAIIRKLKDASQVEKNITPHIFRHTMATDALQGGMGVAEVQRLLGHSNISTTMIYAHIDDEELHTKHKKIIR